MSFMEKSKSKENTSKEEAKNLESLVTEGKKKGFVTYDQLNKSISATKKLSVEELENAISKFSDAGIDIIEDEGEDIKLDINVNEELTVSSRSTDDEDSKDGESENLGSTDDPVRLYLRDMGGVELLSRENEIEIAKRIDAGKELMLNSLCESPFAIKRFIKWYEDLVNEKIMLRDLIDLDANLGNDEPMMDEEGEETPEVDVQDEGNAESNENSSESIDEEEPVSLSISAMEAELLPSIMDKMEVISQTCEVLLSEAKSHCKGAKNTPLRDNKKYTEALNFLVGEISSMHFSSKRVEEMLSDIYDVNKNLVAKEVELLKLAEKHKVKRADFLKEYNTNLKL